MKSVVPRILIAGTGSGCGKTTLTCAILQALVNRQMKVGAFKCGPDYIDPMFHSRITGSGCTNLDSFFFSRNTMNYLLQKHGAAKEISIIEGVMGFYDGLGINSDRTSTYEIAEFTNSPVILVINAKGASLSALAVLQGFLDFTGSNTICGVIFNRCSESVSRILSEEVRKRFIGKVLPLGFMPTMPDCTLESRHLGLVTAAETADLEIKLQKLAQQAEKSIDLDTLIDLAQNAQPVFCEPVKFPPGHGNIRIGVARDNVFCFYYQDNFEALAESGAEFIEFSPLSDSSLPKGIHGLLLGGGYPELYTQRLSGNGSMLASVRNALAGGLPCIAECGGYMYLTNSIAGEPMVGFLPGNCFNTGKLSRFGYINLTSNRDNMLCRAGDSIPAHEFHYWDTSDPGNCFTAEKSTGKRWPCVYASDTLYAGFPHFHFYANPEFAVRFYQRCLRFKEEHV